MNPETLNKLRSQIDALDEELITLLLKRIEVSNRIMKEKPPGQIVDSRREEDILRRYTEGLAKVSTPDKVKAMLRALLALSELYPDGKP